MLQLGDTMARTAICDHDISNELVSLLPFPLDVPVRHKRSFKDIATVLCSHNEKIVGRSESLLVCLALP